MGRTDDAYRCFSMLNPVNHSADEAAAEHYRVEPYVVAADIYAGEGKGGRGGWTWYTGSAGWLYRAAVEGILGIERRGKQITFRPKLPGIGTAMRRRSRCWRPRSRFVSSATKRPNPSRSRSMEPRQNPRPLSRKPATRSMWLSGYLREIKGLKHYLHVLRGGQYSEVFICA
ncbi:hypothetical protein AJ88_07320 [Mesorhizobium amorphae CCBAU 01583]|nr:hypothetical protein AJ88_07320 [Mesorhizobium amorphae CCBAU 01583]